MLWINLSKKHIIRLSFLVVSSIIVIFVYSAISSEAEIEPYYFSDITLPHVAFSFEVIWGENNLIGILEVLEEEDVKSSFFVSGSWLTQFTSEAEMILVKGHELGKYSFSTIPFTQLTEEEISQEFSKFNELTNEILEYRSRLFRPPMGVYNNIINDIANRYGYRTVLWSIDSNEYLVESSKQMADRIFERLHYGGIINFRTSNEYLVDSLPVIINYIRESGYEIVMVSDLID